MHDTSKSSIRSAGAILMTLSLMGGSAWARQDLTPVLPDRPDQKAPAVAAPNTERPLPSDDVEAAELAEPFTSVSAGIELRPPKGSKVIRRAVGDEVARFIDDDRQTVLSVQRLQTSRDTPLNTNADNPMVAGVLDSVAGEMADSAAGKLLRRDLLPIAGYDAGLLAARQPGKPTDILVQTAVIRRSDRYYFLLTYRSPVTHPNIEDDPKAHAAVETFDRVLDSVQVLDQTKLREEQEQRLLNTRRLFVNWTEQKLSDVLIPEQWVRLVKDGKDIGYSYIVEELGNDLPRNGASRGDARVGDGVVIGVRSRTIPEPGSRVDAETWMWTKFDRKQESWSSLAVVTTPDQEPNFASEVGTSIYRIKAVADPSITDEQHPENKGIARQESYQLSVRQISKKMALEPLQRSLPPYYIPQAIGHLLPRLVPLKEPQKFLFASYVSEQREVILRYVDVKASREVEIDGKTVRAIPVEDRIGVEGAVTAHYFTPAGKYLGSINQEAGIQILPTDRQSLLTRWKDANLERPAEVKPQ